MSAGLRKNSVSGLCCPLSARGTIYPRIVCSKCSGLMPRKPAFSRLWRWFAAKSGVDQTGVMQLTRRVMRLIMIGPTQVEHRPREGRARASIHYISSLSRFGGFAEARRLRAPPSPTTNFVLCLAMGCSVRSAWCTRAGPILVVPLRATGVASLNRCCRKSEGRTGEPFGRTVIPRSKGQG